MKKRKIVPLGTTSVCLRCLPLTSCSTPTERPWRCALTLIRVDDGVDRSFSGHDTKVELRGVVFLYCSAAGENKCVGICQVLVFICFVSVLASVVCYPKKASVPWMCYLALWGVHATLSRWMRPAKRHTGQLSYYRAPPSFELKNQYVMGVNGAHVQVISFRKGSMDGAQSPSYYTAEGWKCRRISAKTAATQLNSIRGYGCVSNWHHGPGSANLKSFFLLGASILQGRETPFLLLPTWRCLIDQG